MRFRDSIIQTKINLSFEIGNYFFRYEYIDPVTSCYNDIQEIITISQSPEANIAFSPQPANITDPEIYFTDNSNTNISNSVWDLGDGNIIYDEINFWHYYESAGEYVVKYYITNEYNCTDSVIENLIINPEYNKVNKTEANSFARFKLVKEKYEDFKKNKYLIKDQKSHFYIYRQITNHGVFTGIIGGASVKDYEDNLIKKHENTIHKRESIFKDYLEVTKFHAEPVLLAYKPTKKIQEIINKIILERPEYELSSTLPTNGDTYFAPLFAARIACAGEKIRVTFTLIRSLESVLQTRKPSGVQGTLIVADLPNLRARRAPSSTIVA